MEIWKEITGYEGRYMVSNLGRIKSLSRSYRTGQHHVKIVLNDSIMKPKVRKDGYKLVSLRKDGVVKDAYVHRLVANAFIENSMGYRIINHKDENPSNNAVENLEWCTAQYNNTYNNAHLRGSAKRKKPIIQKSIKGEILKIWDSTADAAKQFASANASKNINNALKNPRRTIAYGFVWEYV